MVKSDHFPGDQLTVGVLLDIEFDLFIEVEKLFEFKKNVFKKLKFVNQKPTRRQTIPLIGHRLLPFPRVYEKTLELSFGQN